MKEGVVRLLCGRRSATGLFWLGFPADAMKITSASRMGQGHYIVNSISRNTASPPRRRALRRLRSTREDFGIGEKACFYHAVVKVCDAAIHWQTVRKACRITAERVTVDVRRAELLKWLIL
jgi:hypothetical protein